MAIGHHARSRLIRVPGVVRARRGASPAGSGRLVRAATTIRPMATHIERQPQDRDRRDDRGDATTDRRSGERARRAPAGARRSRPASGPPGSGTRSPGASRSRRRPRSPKLSTMSWSRIATTKEMARAASVTGIWSDAGHVRRAAERGDEDRGRAGVARIDDVRAAPRPDHPDVVGPRTGPADRRG